MKLPFTLRLPSSARPLALASLVMALATATAPALAGSVEVLHWWTSGGEAKSVMELKRILATKGHEMKDFVVAGGGGDGAMLALKERVKQGNPPAAAQIKGPAIQEWGQLGVLANLDETARKGTWDSQLPKVVADVMKVKGHYVAVPVNVHRVNMMWINRDALKKVSSRAPQSWDEFFSLAEKLQKAGIVPVAHGGQPWQEFTTFETVALGVGGAEFYRSAFVKLDPAALQSPTMERVLTTFRRIKGYTDKGAPGRDWNKATAMVIKGEAAIQFMGDWAKGEFVAAGQTPAKEFICAPAPGTDRAYIFNIDSFALFQLKDPLAMKAQTAFVETVMSPAFQEVFNVNKGSIPAVTGVDRNRFDRCSQESSAHFVAASLLNSLVPSIAHKMVQGDAIEGGLKDAVAAFWNDDKITADVAMARFVATTRKR